MRFYLYKNYFIHPKCHLVGIITIILLCRDLNADFCAVLRNAQYGPHDGFTSSATHAPPTSSSWGTRDGHVTPIGVVGDSSCTSYGQWSPFDDAAHIRLFTPR